ncbi:MAG: hypothetical protein ABR555_07835 [Pyrinomonadaceae bacterium]
MFRSSMPWPLMFVLQRVRKFLKEVTLLPTLTLEAQHPFPGGGRTRHSLTGEFIYCAIASLFFRMQSAATPVRLPSIAFLNATTNLLLVNECRSYLVGLSLSCVGSLEIGAGRDVLA